MTTHKVLNPRETNNWMENQQKKPTIVAKLMGLDTLPVQNSASVKNVPDTRNIRHVYTIGKAIQEHHKQESVKSGRMISNPRNIGSQAYKKKQPMGALGIQKKDSYNHCTRTGPSSTGKCNGNSPNEKRMALVHQKFMEAKRLARNGNLLQSREFQDALEILNLNKHVFLRFLEEPHSCFSNHLYDAQPNPHTNRNCITVLKPSKMRVQPKEERCKWDDLCVEVNTAEEVGQHKNDTIANQTRIVVLKPSLDRSYDMRNEVSFDSSSGRFPECDHMHRRPGDGETKGSREAAKEITRKMQERLSIYRRDGILLPFVQTNGYGDGQVPLNRSLSQRMEEEWSDSFSHVKTLRRSQDCTDKYASPCSLSSPSHSSHSPESLVDMEGRKHISERWVMVTSDGIDQKQSQVHGSNTLGRMLAGPDAKTQEERNGTPGISHGKTLTREHDQRKGHLEIGNTISSEILPVPRSIQDPNNKHSNCQPVKHDASNEVNMQKSTKSMMKGRILSFFFSLKDKRSTSYPSSPHLARAPNKVPPAELGLGTRRSNDLPQCSPGNSKSLQQNLEEIPRNDLSSMLEQGHPGVGTTSAKLQEAPDFESRRQSENSTGNGEQPSPVSVLEATFDEEDLNGGSCVPSEVMISADCIGGISRIPPFQSIARTLSLDDDESSSQSIARTLSLDDDESSSQSIACTLSLDDNDLSSTHDPHRLHNSPEHTEVEEWPIFARKFLASSGLGGNENSTALLDKLHSLDSPLDPTLLEKYIEPKREGAKPRQRRSNQRLLFDCINFLLLEIIHDELGSNHKLPNFCFKKQNEQMDAAFTLTEKVLMKLREWFSADGVRSSYRHEDMGLSIDSLIRKQVGGKEWELTMRTEVVEMGSEIERCVLDDLIEEISDGFILGCL